MGWFVLLGHSRGYLLYTLFAGCPSASWFGSMWVCGEVALRYKSTGAVGGVGDSYSGVLPHSLVANGWYLGREGNMLRISNTCSILAFGLSQRRAQSSNQTSCPSISTIILHPSKNANPYTIRWPASPKALWWDVHFLQRSKWECKTYYLMFTQHLHK